ncbi:MAG: cation:proton antiporter [Acidimicrobiia bacterium]
MDDQLVALGASLLAACVLARAGQRVGLPTIPLFIVAGIVFGPHTPGLSFVDDPDDLALLATLGVVLLLFSLGLEFSMRELTSGGRRMLEVGAFALTANIAVGVALGFGLGWGDREALVITGAVAISSSAIVSKLLVELGRLARPETRLILGIIVVEDIFLALYLACIQPVLDESQGAGAILESVGLAFAFLLCLAVIARLLPRVIGRLVATDDDDLLTIGFMGLVVLVAGAGHELGVSDAISAFMVGVILAGSAARSRIERLVLPLRDVFAAVFFFTFGLTIDPADLPQVAGPIALAVLASLVANVAVGFFATRRMRLDTRSAPAVGFTILARGEFSLVLAAMGLAVGLDGRLGPFIAGYVLVLAIASPILAAHAPRLGALLRKREDAPTPTTTLDPAPAHGRTAAPAPPEPTSKGAQ